MLNHFKEHNYSNQNSTHYWLKKIILKRLLYKLIYILIKHLIYEIKYAYQMNQYLDYFWIKMKGLLFKSKYTYKYIWSMVSEPVKVQTIQGYANISSSRGSKIKLFFKLLQMCLS